MKFLTADQIRKADAFTIENEPISSIDLMERASEAFVKKLLEFANPESTYFIFCGVGNNGGDGLAVARLLFEKKYSVSVYIIGNLDKASLDFGVNYHRLPKHLERFHISHVEDIPSFNREILIDALFGSGLTRPIEGLYGKLIDHINQSGCDVVSVDIASGLSIDSPSQGKIIEPSRTISFQNPKLPFVLPKCHQFVGAWDVVDIGLNKEFIEALPSDYYMTERAEMQNILPQKSKFDHKGNAGMLLLVSGSRGKIGAAVLAAKAAIRSGLGLLVIHSPTIGLDVLQTSVPEAMVSEDDHNDFTTNITIPEKATAIAIGPGIGTKKETEKSLAQLLNESSSPVILDADAINIIANSEYLINLVPKNSILTPHPKEFEQLVGSWDDDFQKLEMLKNFCTKHSVNVVLKGAFSAVCNADGIVHFNPTGNAGMATGGSGDVLTGIIGGLLAQGMIPFDALRLGVYIHGLAGDIAEQKMGEISLHASSIVKNIHKAFLAIREGN